MAVALVVAAGLGERLGASGPKAFVVLAGRPMLDWSLAALRAVEEVERIVVALPAGVEPPAGVVGVAGGEHRSHSVRNALDACQRRTSGAALQGVRSATFDDVVLVHDAARPLLTPELVRACLDGLGDADAAVAAAPVADTIKQADAAGRVVRTLDRSALWAVQTPQVFRRAALERALAQSDEVLAAATDDAGLVEAQGGTVRVIEATARNLKVTTEVDLRLAELLLC